MRKIDYILKNINKGLGMFSGILILIQVFFIIFEVISRNVFGRPTSWSMDFARYLLLYATFLAGAFTMQDDGHIRIELVIEKIKSKKAKMIIIRFGLALSLIYIVMLFFYSLRYLLTSIQKHWLSESQVAIPLVYLYSAMVLGSILLVLTVVMKIIFYADRPVEKNTSPEKE